MRLGKLIEWLQKTGLTILVSAITSGLVSGLILAFLSNYLEKDINSYQLKLEKYSALGEQLSNVASNNADPMELDRLLNSSLLFGSEEVANAVLDFNQKLREGKIATTQNGIFISRDELIPIFKAIRNDLGLSSDFLDKRDIFFFQLANCLAPSVK